MANERREKLEALLSAVVPACNAYLLLKGQRWGDTAEAERKMAEAMDYLCVIAGEVAASESMLVCGDSSRSVRPKEE